MIFPVVTAEMVVLEGTGRSTGAAAFSGATGLAGGVAGVFANVAVSEFALGEPEPVAGGVCGAEARALVVAVPA
ncbi:MAG: hypothetical protein J2P58_12985, partial [Acidimicrobiaceae bacterium]|nr:hypothetical protein [Acidimicrobiaceae bacterium]